LQITTTINRIKRFKDCEPVVKALQAKLGKHHPGDEPIPFSTILDTCGLGYTISCCRAEPQHSEVWYHYAADCLEAVKHLMNSLSYTVVSDHRKRHLGLKIPDRSQKGRPEPVLYGGRCAFWSTYTCERQAYMHIEVAEAAFKLKQGKFDEAIDSVIKVADPGKLRSLIKHFRRIVDAGWVPLVVVPDDFD